MANETETATALGDIAARQLANATKTVPQMSRITPRWLTHLLQWVPVEAGIYRLNRVKDESKVIVDCSARDERDLPQTFVDYEEHPREYLLSAVNTVLDVHTRVSDLYSVPHNQVTEQSLAATQLHLPPSPVTPSPVLPINSANFPTQPNPGSSLATPFYFLQELRSPEAQLASPGLPSDSIHLASVPSPSSQAFDVNLIRRDFPILQERVNGRQLIWFDNAATTQKPQSVINHLSYFYQHENSNIHRAAHELAARATDAYEGARQKVQHFLGASSPNEIVFVRGATEAINLVAQTWGRQEIQKDDEIVISWLEHHANIVPWQMLCAEKDAKLKVIPVDDDGQILLDEYRKLLGDRTKLVSFSQVSNALGTVTPAEIMTKMAHACGAKVLVDGAQAVSHMRVNVQLLDADFYVFSGHKLFAPTGIGVLYGKEALLNSMPPWQGAKT